MKRWPHNAPLGSTLQSGGCKEKGSTLKRPILLFISKREIHTLCCFPYVSVHVSSESDGVVRGFKPLRVQLIITGHYCSRFCWHVIPKRTAWLLHDELWQVSPKPLLILNSSSIRMKFWITRVSECFGFFSVSPSESSTVVSVWPGFLYREVSLMFPTGLLHSLYYKSAYHQIDPEAGPITFVDCFLGG